MKKEYNEELNHAIAIYKEDMLDLLVSINIHSADIDERLHYLNEIDYYLDVVIEDIARYRKNETNIEIAKEHYLVYEIYEKTKNIITKLLE